MKLRKITKPVQTNYFEPAPEGWFEGKSVTTLAPASGYRAEARVLPDGRLALEVSDRYTMCGQPRYYVYESEQAYLDAARREPQYDPEERGGRWFSGSYATLKVTEKYTADAKEYRGYKVENVCTCHQCGVEVNYYDAHYLAGGEGFPQYFPFCSSTCVEEALKD